MAKLWITLLAFFAGFQCWGGPAADPEARFVDRAASRGMLEVRLAEAAASHTASDSVRTFAESVLAEHHRLDSGLAQAAQEVHVDLPKGMSETDRDEYIRLAGFRGLAFDREYVAAMALGQEEAIAVFRTETVHSRSQVAQWAEATLPTLEKQLAQARQLSAPTLAASASK